ncbi:MAG: hypothetical protein QOJ29_2636 [Thermoleophilaceae bacterium]|jgi:uncharacterized repeat protein (TIGR01451 family)|nr:hypothetical protein [Thermoleophilaceae bacterium]
MWVDGSILKTASRKVAGLTAVTAVALVAASSAQAYQAASGWTVTDYVTDFTHLPDRAGPVGLAFDGSGNLLVTDQETAALHKVPPGGGTTAAATLVRNDFGHATGLAFDKDGHLYLARGTKNDVVEINPASGEIIRQVASGLPCPAALATDPVSGDLFVSNVFCTGGGIKRITGFHNGPGVATNYAGVQDADGLTFGPDGTLYAAAEDKVIRIAGTNSSTPGSVSAIANVPEADGIVYAPATARDDEYLVVVRNDGEIDRLDFNGTLTPVMTGGSRGDLVTVGPDRCIYADLQDRVVKVGPVSGLCNFSPPVQPDESAVLGERKAAPVVDTAVKSSAPKSVKRGSRFTIKLKVANKSAKNAHTTTVTDTLPKGTKFVSARSIKGVTCKVRGRKLTCRKASLAAKKSFTIKIVLRAISGSRYTNTARVKSNDLDPAPGNNKSKTTTVVKGSNSVLGVQRQGGQLPRTTG